MVINTILRVPTSTQWITFPVAPSEAAPIAWSEGKVPRSAFYYITTCFFGVYKDEKLVALPNSRDVPLQAPELTIPILSTEKTENFVVWGRCKLYIAAEYIEAQYEGGIMKPFHILDIAKKDPAGGADHKEPSSWVTLKLNDCFQYGQSASIQLKDTDIKIERFIVYHPPIAKAFTFPKPYQHRFTGTPITSVVQAGLQGALAAAPGQFSSAAEVVGKVLDRAVEEGKKVVGHPLHTFLSAKEALKVWEKVATLLGTTNPNEMTQIWNKIPLIEKYMLAVQHVEASSANVENKAAEEAHIMSLDELTVLNYTMSRTLPESMVKALLVAMNNDDIMVECRQMIAEQNMLPSAIKKEFSFGTVSTEVQKVISPMTKALKQVANIGGSTPKIWPSPAPGSKKEEVEPTGPDPVGRNTRKVYNSSYSRNGGGPGTTGQTNEPTQTPTKPSDPKSASGRIYPFVPSSGNQAQKKGQN